MAVSLSEIAPQLVAIMTDEEFRDRYIAQLVKRIVASDCWDEATAKTYATEEYDSCPRAEMSLDCQEAPEETADVTWNDFQRGDTDPMWP